MVAGEDIFHLLRFGVIRGDWLYGGRELMVGGINNFID